MSEGMKHRHIVVDYYDVQDKFLACVGEGRPWKEVGPYHSKHTQPMESKLRTYAQNKDRDDDEGYDLFGGGRNNNCKGCNGKGKDEDGDQCAYCLGRGKTAWEGARPADTLEWINHGFRAKEFTHSAAYVPKSDKRRAFWNEEEGEVDIGRLYSGFDDFYMDSQIRPSRPGMRIQIEYSFAWSTAAATIAQYGAWVAGFIRSLEITGYDLVVDMWVHLDHLYHGDDYNQRTSLLIRVKRENEVSNFTEWSALFSPSGYRHLGFVAKCIGGDKINKQAVSSLGTCVMGSGWDVQYDQERSTCMIRCNQVSGSNANPKDQLTKAAIKAGVLPDTTIA